METKAHYTVVGAFVLSLVVGLLIFVMWVSNIDFQQGKHYAIYFEGSVSGLREQEVVTYNGVPIGNVIKIDVDPKRLDKIRVLVDIDKPELIRTSSIATLDVKGISGNLYVRIQPSTGGKPLLCCKEGEKYPIIPSTKSPFQKLVSESPKVIQSFLDLANSLEPFFDKENQDNFKETLKNSAGLTKTLKEKTGGTLYEFTQLTQELRSAAKNFNRLIQKLERDPREFLFNKEDEGYEIQQ